MILIILRCVPRLERRHEATIINFDIPAFELVISIQFRAKYTH